MILVKRDHDNQAVDEIISMAEKSEIRVIEGSENDLWRMARDNLMAPRHSCFSRKKSICYLRRSSPIGGLIWMLDGAKYPVNIGFVYVLPKSLEQMRNHRWSVE